MTDNQEQNLASDKDRAASDERGSQDYPAKNITSAVYCYYNGQQYSPGAIICLFGKQYVCSFDGAWNPNGESCQSDWKETI
jgi:hypothetical protein